MKRSKVIQYLVVEYYDGDEKRAAEATGYAAHQISSWIKGEREPQKGTVEYFMHCAFAPEFKVVTEFYNFNPYDRVRTQIRDALNGYEDHPGIYAFYDSMANLLYVGKATSNLLDEMYNAILRGIDISFPKGVTQVPQKRYEVVRFLSAYDVGVYSHLDYPRHVESLILRLSKPPLNQNIGQLRQLQAES